MRRALVTAGLIGLMIAGAHAQEGDVARGRAFAQQLCGRCHAVLREQTASPNRDAPGFSVIAQVPGLTALALTVSLQSAHDKMPDLVLETQERLDVIAYILSLQRR